MTLIAIIFIYNTLAISTELAILPTFPFAQAEKYFNSKYKVLKNSHWKIDHNSTINIIKNTNEKTINLVFNKKVNINTYFTTQNKFVLMGREKINDRAPDWIFLGIPAKGIYIEVSPQGDIDQISWIIPWKDTRAFKNFEDHLKDIDKLFTTTQVSND